MSSLQISAMGKRNSPNKAPDREKKRDKIFDALVKLSQNLQRERQFLEDKVKFLHEVIYRMKMEQKVESLKNELICGLKQREAIVYKHRYENEENDVADFRECFDYLSQKCSGPTDISNDVSNKGEGSPNKALQDEVWNLKSEIEKLKFEKNSEISALLAEKNFVWNQLKKMESDMNEQLRKKSDEVKYANERVQIVVNRAEELQMSNEKLRTEFIKVESESVQKSEEIFKLLKEIELLKSRSGSATPPLLPCRAEAAASLRWTKKSILQVKKESDSSQTIEKTTRTRQTARKSTGGKAPSKQFIKKGSSNSKRKANDVIIIPDTPKLFTSAFKVPKLKSSPSPRMV